MQKVYDVIIIGGGISGLSSAWYLQQEAQTQGIDLSYALLEQSGRWGGKILTEETAVSPTTPPFIIEGGPDSFISQKPWALQLARELGLEDELLPTNDHKRKTFVLSKGRPMPFPDGVLLIVPTKIMPFAKSRLISPLGKLRMGLDWFIPAKKDGADETLADFIKRRLGREALDKIAEPLLSGIYNADAYKQSIMATFPRFRALEEKHGSLIKGMLASQRMRKAQAKNPAANGNKKPVSMFTSFENGMQTLVDAVRARLTGDCELATAVTQIEQRDWRLGVGQESPAYLLTLNDGRKIATQNIILAVPAFVAARLMAELTPDAADKLNEIRYVSTGTVSLAFRRDEVAHPLNGFGIVIPRSEKRPINAITWSSTKFDKRAPEGHILLRVFIGGSRNPQMMDVDDEELMAIIRQELKAIMDIDAAPIFHRIFRWDRSNPQYDVGHLERVEAIEAALPEGVFVTGSPYRGVGVPDCVHQAQQTAVAVIREQLTHPFTRLPNPT